ncbi:MAG: arginine--tRNA ligase [bacterium]|nr:arginine--tRNA ligase [bacterium]
MKEGKMDRINNKDVSGKYTVQRLRLFIENEVVTKSPRNVDGVSVPLKEVPVESEFDYGVNLMPLVKKASLPAEVIGQAIGTAITQGDGSMIEEIALTGPFLNFKINMPKFAENGLNEIIDNGLKFGNEDIGHGQIVAVDMSSPNIAKRMSIGHLRSTIIGDAISNLYRASGYEVVRDNHIGDWGTQFGNLIHAIKAWGDEGKLKVSKDPIGDLQDLYVKFHSETEKNKDLENEGRSWFLKLEQGDTEAKRIWKMCVDLSLKEFNEIYDVLNVKFEKTLGESFYEPLLKDTMSLVSKNPAGRISEGALIIDMESEGYKSAIVQKSDGASVYFTRDLACAIYRQKEMGADKVVYVVGEDQKFYFQQLFGALRKLGFTIGENAVHVPFGMIRMPEGKRMSTRKGEVILLKDVISEGMERAKKVLFNKNPELSKNTKLSDKVIKQVAIGALKWNDLSQDATRSFEFGWDRALKLDGNSAPYVQYTAVRAKSVLELSGFKVGQLRIKDLTNMDIFKSPAERALVRQIFELPNVISESLKSHDPSKIAAFTYEVAKRFNSFYTKHKILKADNGEDQIARLKLVAATHQVITNSLAILGIEVPEQM